MRRNNTYPAWGWGRQPGPDLKPGLEHCKVQNAQHSTGFLISCTLRSIRIATAPSTASPKIYSKIPSSKHLKATLAPPQDCLSVTSG